MKTVKLSKADHAARKRRKKMLLWQGEQLKKFQLFKLVRVRAVKE
jgi:hypothetical protein